MSNSFKFDDLQPTERDTFELPDGTLIEFRDRTDLSATQMGRMTRMRTEFTNLHTAFESGKLNETSLERKSAQLQDLLGEFVMIILPDMPEDVLNRLTAGQRNEIVNWWKKAQEEKKGLNSPEAA